MAIGGGEVVCILIEGGEVKVMHIESENAMSTCSRNSLPD